MSRALAESERVTPVRAHWRPKSPRKDATTPSAFGLSIRTDPWAVGLPPSRRDRAFARVAHVEPLTIPFGLRFAMAFDPFKRSAGPLADLRRTSSNIEHLAI